ncbi:MAG: AI-2E family transporter [Desulfobacterales bacterium]|jgi:predicted PurR-regulated permease PerM|nr:AI-2E family transporter [Desulfobacterales bacterium]
MDRPVLNKVVLFLVVLLISLLFISMIRQFLMVILVTGIFSAMAQPIFRRFLKWFNGRKNASAAATLAFILLIIFLPLAGLLGIVAGQAIKISNSVKPWIEQRIKEPTAFDELMQSVPYYDQVKSYQDVILEKAGALVGKMSTFLFDSLQTVTLSTVNFIFLFFVFLYTMFFFLKEGDQILNKMLYYLPLTDEDERRMLDRFTSVTRATIKGTLVIGLIQGTFAGLAFWVVGIDSALFWATIMTVLSIIPAVGSALIWFPAAIILAAGGHFVQAIGLMLFCGLLVGSVDNLLRPRFVGKDTQMHELLIFFGTLGGISLFGLIGFIIGPIIAALFTTVWDIYGVTFKEYLPEVKIKS